MKRKLKILSLLFVAGLSYAQTSGLSTSENYIYTKNCLNEDCSKKTEAVEYSDGLGRSKQVINIKGSPNGKDIVTPVEYDNFGRQLKSYLPIPQSGTQNGAIYTDPKSNASQTYGTDLYFYAESVLENSPSAKLLSQTKPGMDYQGHSENYQYEMNIANDVKKYTVSTSWTNKATNNTISVSGMYNAGELIKTSVTDEDGNKTIEFKNGKGQTILVRKKVSGTQNADTYYIYNKYEQLVYVIPPLASVSSSLTSDLLNGFCYQYRYDSKNRQVEKKLPGKGWEYIVYDKQDRVLMTQDANMGASRQWLFTKYDKLGRAVYTGIYTSSQNYGSAGREAEQIMSNSAVNVQNESKNAGGFSANGITAYYTNSVYPTAFTKILSVNYFDVYPSGSPSRPTQILTKNTIGDNMADAVNTKNLPTASYVKNIEDDNWTKNYIWYDNKGRTIGTHTINHLGGYTKTESSLDFAGVPQLSKVYHKRLSSDTEKVITQTFEYDSQNRLKKQWHQVGSNPQELLSENTYNDLSQIINKKVGNNLQSIDYTYNLRGATIKMNDPANLGTDLFGYSLSYYNPSSSSVGKYNGSISEISWKTAQDNVLRKYTYQYDALNRLKKGVYSEPNSSIPENEFFNESAEYDLGGNITSLQRNAKGQFSSTAELIDNLTYTYSGNRLNTVSDISANYRGYPDTSGNLISYDDNGNMTDHIDKGILKIDYNILDLPVYVKFNEFAAPDRNNKIYVNTTYVYRADGTKVRKIHNYKDPSYNSALGNKTTDYLDGFQYEYDWNPLAGIPPTNNFQLKFVPTAEGYYNFENNKYIYSYTDHLGNVRLSYTKNGSGTEIIEEGNFYPFGLKHEGYNSTIGNPAYNYGYNGKELQKETGWSDYGARMYMSDIARWGVIDPLAESSRRFSPYNYALNNPVMFIDPDGRKAISPDARPEMIGGISTGGAAEYLATGGRAEWGSFDKFITPYDYTKDWKSGGGGGGSFKSGTTVGGIMAALGINMANNEESFQQIIGGMNLWQQLVIAGFKNPEKTKAYFGDYVSLITKVPALSDLYDLTAAKFKLVEKTLIDGHVPPFSKDVEIAMSNIDNILEYGYVIGHELNHVVDNIYNWEPFLEIVPHTGQTANVFTILSEYRSYSWEKKLGNDIDILKKIEYTKIKFPAAYSIFERYFKQFKNSSKFVTP
jgi:RHS repeat-associated protein